MLPCITASMMLMDICGRRLVWDYLIIQKYLHLEGSVVHLSLYDHYIVLLLKNQQFSDTSIDATSIFFRSTCYLHVQ
jgi:hypothetical protein